MQEEMSSKCDGEGKGKETEPVCLKEERVTLDFFTYLVTMDFIECLVTIRFDRSKNNRTTYLCLIHVFYIELKSVTLTVNYYSD